jgi:hypothetical protein
LTEVSDDVIVIGHPKGYYDEINKYPIVKGGIISSSFSTPFENNRYFPINARLFEGSSGSLVLSKPINFKISPEGRLLFSREGKQFAFFGYLFR